MGRVKKTEAELKEAHRLRQAKWRAKNKDKVKEYHAKWYAKNKEARKEQMSKYITDKITHFVTYAHTNSKGDVYIGSGTNLRPYQFSSNGRSIAWHEAFSSDCQITILAEFKDKEQAMELEAILIDEHNLDTLVNKRNAKAQGNVL